MSRFGVAAVAVEACNIARCVTPSRPIGLPHPSVRVGLSRRPPAARRGGTAELDLRCGFSLPDRPGRATPDEADVDIAGTALGARWVWYDTLMTLRALLTTLALTLTACSDDAGDTTTAESTSEAPELGLYQPCQVDEPWSGLPSVDHCKEGLVCSFDEYGCNQGLCTMQCELSPSGADPCPIIDGVQSACRLIASEIEGERACIIPCGPTTACPQNLAKALVCVASRCVVPLQECGVSSGET